MKSKNSIFECLIAPIPKQQVVVNPNWRRIKKKHRKHKKQKRNLLKIKKKLVQPEVLKNYKLYIKSKYWDKRRSIHFKKFGYKCAVCGSSKELNVHHLYYGNFSHELDEDLVTLCRLHHELFHSQYLTKKDMRAETNQFIIEQAEVESFPVI